jgi:hypothetical protein
MLGPAPGTPGGPLAWVSKVAQAVRRHRRHSIDAEPFMKKFNNTLEGTDCGNAGLPAHSCDIAKAKTILRIVAKTSGNALRADLDTTSENRP